MQQKRILSVQDISCFGKCSNTVMLPVLSAAGMEVVMLPTALLSTHTGGFTGFTFLDLTEEMEKMMQHWESIPLTFDLLCTGYFGSAAQLQAVSAHLPKLMKPSALRVIDPVLGDDGRLYSIYNDAYVEEMRRFCNGADIITPNMTEASLLAGIPFAGNRYDPARCEALLQALHALGVKQVLLTGVMFGEDEIGIVGHTEGDPRPFTASSRYLNQYLHGTGDTLTSSLVATLAQGGTFEQAARKALRFVAACIDETEPVLAEHAYGLKFEPCLSMLTPKE